MIGKTFLEHLFETGAAGFDGAKGRDEAQAPPDAPDFTSEVSAAFSAASEAPQPFTSAITISGDGDNDVIRGTGDDDVLLGLGGNDRLIGRAGDDRLIGAAGDDKLQGGGGADTMIGSSGNDSLFGGGGDDNIKGGGGNDTIRGGGGNDTIKGNGGSDTIKGNGGDDSIIGGGGADTIIAGPGNDTIKGGGGNDLLQFSQGDINRSPLTTIKAFQSGKDTVDLSRLSGLGPFSTLDLVDTSRGAELRIGDSVILFQGRTKVQLSASDFLLANNDPVDPTPDPDPDPDPNPDPDPDPDPVDPFLGTDGPDTLSSEGTDDSIRGLAGNDVLEAGEGVDTLVGGEGSDLFVIRVIDGALNDGVDIVEDFNLVLDTISLTEVIGDREFTILEDFVQLSTAGGDTTVSVNVSGAFQDALILQGVELDLNATTKAYNFKKPPEPGGAFTENPYGFANSSYVNADPAATPDGEFIAFVSTENEDGSPDEPFLADLNDEDRATGDIFIRNTATDTLLRVTTAPDTFTESSSPAISNDGKIVAYATITGNRVGDVFVRNMADPGSDPILVSVNSDGEAGGGVPFILSGRERGGLQNSTANESVSVLDISGDGSKVVFVTKSDLTGAEATDANGQLDVYLRDLSAGTTTLITQINGVAAGGSAVYQDQNNGEDSQGDLVKISDDGRYIAFTSFNSFTDDDFDGAPPTNLNAFGDTEDIYLHDTVTGQFLLISSPAPGGTTSFDMSADGSRIVFASQEAVTPEDTNGLSDVYLATIDLASFTVTSRERISEVDGQFQTLGGKNFAPVISPDGQKVAFLTAATDFFDFDIDRISAIQGSNDSDSGEELVIVDLTTGDMTVPADRAAIGDSHSLIPHAVFTEPGLIYRKEVEAEAGTSRSISDSLGLADLIPAPVGDDVPDGLTNNTNPFNGDATFDFGNSSDGFVYRSTIDSPSDNDVFAFETSGSSSQPTLGIFVRGVDGDAGTLADPIISLHENTPTGRNGPGEPIALFTNDNASGRDSFIEFTPDRDTRYFVRVESSDGGLGDYTIRVGPDVDLFG